MRKGATKKDGQVWAERHDDKKEFLFLIIGHDGDHYRLLCLEDASEDLVLRRAIDKPNDNWRRVT